VFVLFVQHLRKLYGDMYLSYNVHNLVHLAQYVKVHGNLDSLSAFKFENVMQKLKRHVRKPESPCCQVVKRLAERDTVRLQVVLMKYNFFYFVNYFVLGEYVPNSTISEGKQN